MDALIALRDDGVDAEKFWPFRCPITRRSRTVLFTGEDDQRNAISLILHRSVVDRHDFIAREMTRNAAFGSRRELIAQSYVGESSANHYFVVATAGAVG